MHGVVGTVVAGVGIVAEEIDPTVQPVRQSFYVFVVLALCTALLIWSFMRHLRRAQGNLGSARAEQAADPTDPTGTGDLTPPAQAAAADGPAQRPGEGESR
jgi:hypothetical protein